MFGILRKMVLGLALLGSAAAQAPALAPFLPFSGTFVPKPGVKIELATTLGLTESVGPARPPSDGDVAHEGSRLECGFMLSLAGDPTSQVHAHCTVWVGNEVLVDREGLLTMSSSLHHFKMVSLDTPGYVPVRCKVEGAGFAGFDRTITIRVLGEALLPGSIRMPDVKGEKPEAALRKLRSAGFTGKLDVLHEKSEPGDPMDGRIVEQDPPAGKRAPKDVLLQLRVEKK